MNASRIRCKTGELLGLGAWVPFLVVCVPLEGQVRASVRGCRSVDDWRALMAYLRDDEELDELCDLVRRLRDRQAAG